jgi:hypothetical protein
VQSKRAHLEGFPAPLEMTGEAETAMRVPDAQSTLIDELEFFFYRRGFESAPIYCESFNSLTRSVTTA